MSTGRGRVCTVYCYVKFHLAKGKSEKAKKRKSEKAKKRRIPIILRMLKLLKLYIFLEKEKFPNLESGDLSRESELIYVRIYLSTYSLLFTVIYIVKK